MSTALFLISLGVGYKILAEATKEKHYLKTLGQVVGVAIMVLSVIGAACSACYGHKGMLGGKFGGIKKGHFCPAPQRIEAPSEAKPGK